jgi:hypothetical protein
MKKHNVFILLAVCLPSLMLASIFPKTGTAGLQFLKLGVDARAVGMGEAYTAVSNDISSTYWNPAGLALQTDMHKQFFFNHTSMPADISHEFVAGSYKTDWGVFALSASILHMNDMDITDEEHFGPTGETFTCSDMAIGATYAKRLTDKFAFGATAKYLREDLYKYNVEGFSVDLGSSFNTGWRNLIIGMSMRNFGPDLQYKIDDDGDGKYGEDPYDQLDNDGDGLVDEDSEEMAFKLPLDFSLGLCADLYRNDAINSYLISSVQVDNCVDREETFNLGFEYKRSLFLARCGAQFNTETGNSAVRGTCGFGFIVPVSFAVMEVDWAYTQMGYLQEDFLHSEHRLTLKILTK